MTFTNEGHALQCVIDRKKTIGDWILENLFYLFGPKREENYALIEVCYFLMRRVGGSYAEWFTMDEDKRDYIFTQEKAIFDEEIKQNSKNV